MSQECTTSFTTSYKCVYQASDSQDYTEDQNQVLATIQNYVNTCDVSYLFHYNKFFITRGMTIQ